MQDLRPVPWQCVEATQHLSVESAADLLLLADSHSCPQLKENATELILSQLTEVMATEGWTRLVDENTGSPYYRNTASGEMSWDRPPLPAADALPEGWAELVDEKLCNAPPDGLGERGRPKTSEKVSDLERR